MIGRLTPRSARRHLVRVFAWLVGVATGVVAIPGEPDIGAEKARAPLAVGEKGEQLIKALTTTNIEPKLYRRTAFREPIFPETFDWKEYVRVTSAIKDLEANSEKEWASIVEHMTDDEYCYTVKVSVSAYNYSRGDVCYLIAQAWVNQGYAGLMPMDPPHYQYQVPEGMDAKALQKWCRERHDKRLYEIQIEAAEWAISIIPKKSRMPKESQELAIADIQERIANIRKTRKAIPGKFFYREVLVYSAESAAILREKQREKQRRKEGALSELHDDSNTGSTTRAADSPRTQPVQQQVGPQVQVDDSQVASLYANFCRVTGSPEELIIDFVILGVDVRIVELGVHTNCADWHGGESALWRG